MKNYNLQELVSEEVYKVKFYREKNSRAEVREMTGEELRNLTPEIFHLYHAISAEKKPVTLDVPMEPVRRISGRNDWLEVWKTYENTKLAKMVENLAADLTAGYDYFSKMIETQREEIEAFKREYDEILLSCRGMTGNEINKKFHAKMKDIHFWEKYA